MELPEELFSGSEPLVLRCFLLVAGACRGFLHREMEICTRDGPSRGTDNQGSGTASRKWARPAAGSRVLQTAQEAAATMMAAACSSSAQSGFMPLRNCFELFRVSFSVDESWNSWLMSCETVPDTAGDAETPEWLVSDALRTALPLVGIDEAGIQVPVSSSEPRPESQCDGRPDDGGSFVQVFCREY